ncbi:ladinin (predicted), isoform CRA_a [Rattus norvegicus]|uniref:Ladinin (Predicted), isoform CRA_a n=1 Tax=Rattus norvegicus TaxID=10116 RepID=A6ICG7_RAT|nr:ladinin (predicted), isoform CRA_a [Rattus norvegicus]
MCYIRCLCCVPHHPAALIGSSVPFCLTPCLFSHPEKTFPRKDLINSFSLRHKWLVMLMGLFPWALLSWSPLWELRDHRLALLEEETHPSLPSPPILRS